MRKSQGISKETIKDGGIRLGRVALMAALLSTSAFVPCAHANPEGGQVVGGSATISESGKKLDVHQHTHRTVIDWRSFNIDVDEHTEFHQPSSSATALNRVKSADPSQILGKLSANGNIVLVNPNGVFFGRDSVVDVNGLVATSADIDTDKFMGGSNHFNIPGKPDAAIVNEGTITAKDAGLVGLVAPNVENHGVIKAKMGRVHLASGDTVVADFYGDGLLEVEVKDENVTSQFVGNTGRLEAEGGIVAMTAAAARQTVNSLIVAKGELKAPTISKQGGKIIIAAAGSNKTDKDGASAVIVQASLDASGRDEGEQGGSIEVLGDHIAILDGTVMDASGHSAPIPPTKPTTDNGTATMMADKNVRSEEDFLAHESRAGGSIKIGGDYLGKGDTQTAKTLYVGDYVLALNDAIDNGDAGRTIFWSDDTTDFNGLVLARGGTQGGNGGFLETSGKMNLKVNGFADLAYRAGGYNKGTYLLDPADITIYGNVDPAFASTDASVNLATNLEVWLDATDAGTITESGGLVSQWSDKSGNNHHVSQSNDTYKPGEGLINGQNAIHFNADWLLQSGADLNINNDASIFTVASFDTLGTGAHGIVSYYLNSTNNFGTIQLQNTGRWASYAAGGGPKVLVNNHFATGTPELLGYVMDNGALEVFSNGVSTKTGTAGGAIGAGGNFTVGAYTPTVSQAMFGLIGEVIMFNDDLSATETTLVNQYQSAKWGVALTPPGTGATEADKAMASDGYGVFTADYLERLSTSADIALVADNTITLDLQGDTLALDDDRNINLTTTNGSITDVSAGTIRTNRTAAGGNISITAGGTGDILLDTTNLEALNGGLVNLSAAGGGIDVVQASALNLGTVSGQSVSLRTTGGTADVTLNNMVTATDSGNALTVASGRNLINTAGAGALNATHSSGRFLVYSANPADDTLGGLSSDFKRYNKTYAGYAPGSVTETGDGLLYSIAPTLSVTADDVSRVYGDANSFTYTVDGAGLIDGDTLGTALSGTAALDSAATNASNAGSYAITAAAGTLASDLGYQLAFNNGTLTVTKAALTATADDATREYGDANPALTGTISGFKLSESIADLDTAPLYSTIATQVSPAGTYAITASGGADINYTFSYVDGTLTITPAPKPEGNDSVQLPPSWERVAYANDGLNIGVQSSSSISSASAPSGSTATSSSAPAAGEEISSETDENGESDENGKPSVRWTQAGQEEETISIPGLNVKIEASLAQTLGLTQEKINEMFR